MKKIIFYQNDSPCTFLEWASIIKDIITDLKDFYFVRLSMLLEHVIELRIVFQTWEIYMERTVFNWTYFEKKKNSFKLSTYWRKRRRNLAFNWIYSSQLFHVDEMKYWKSSKFFVHAVFSLYVIFYSFVFSAILYLVLVLVLIYGIFRFVLV